MNNRCTFKQGRFNCGSYAFNLHKEDIEQGDYCDHHYWQDQAMKAAQERDDLVRTLDKAEAHIKFLEDEIRTRGLL
jgi:predicted  nucleic acid-binding Zn-ribbon protein